jgi:hypothetical protein
VPRREIISDLIFSLMSGLLIKATRTIRPP